MAVGGAAYLVSKAIRASRVVAFADLGMDCLLYTSDAADERSSVDLGGRRIIKKKHILHSRVTRTMTLIRNKLKQE